MLPHVLPGRAGVGPRSMRRLPSGRTRTASVRVPGSGPKMLATPVVPPRRATPPETRATSAASRYGAAASGTLQAAMGVLDGQAALITGASSGIGRATALAFAREGAAVALLARRADELKRVAQDIRAAGGRASVHPADLADREATR